MTEKLSDVAARIGSVRQLSAVIGAMRGIAAARAREWELNNLADRHTALARDTT